MRTTPSALFALRSQSASSRSRNGLELRIGITTGEALVSLGASPSEGEGMASGDVVNTAARLQSAAPVNGILADETTYRATRAAIEYRRCSLPSRQRARAEPIAVWEATAARSRFGVDVTHHARAELVGREQELAFLRDAFQRARTSERRSSLPSSPSRGWERAGSCTSSPGSSTPTPSSSPGVRVAASPTETGSRSGRSRRSSRRRPASSNGTRRRRPQRSCESRSTMLSPTRATPAGSSRTSARSSGLETDTGLGGDRRGEAFAAWRRFLEALAEQRPLVLVLEDLHWADEGLLDFVDELVDWLSGVPLLVVCSARPELLERRPGWGGGKLNASTVGLSPLSQDQTALLISHVLERSLLPAEIQQALLERSEGNPLYAEQFAQLYLERGSADDLPLPETLQGIVAARLDGLSADEKALLQDASVVGKVFWTGALRRDERRPPRCCTRSSARASSPGSAAPRSRARASGRSPTCSLRDVAYGQIPRAERAQKHRATAEWIESLGRPDDHAELLAFHWSSALELARAAGHETDEARDAPCRLAFRAAGDRSFVGQRLPGRGGLLRRRARSLAEGRRGAAAAPLPLRRCALHRRRRPSAWTRSRTRVTRCSRSATAKPPPEAELSLSLIWWHRGQGDEAAAHLARAEELAERRSSADGGPRAR